MDYLYIAGILADRIVDFLRFLEFFLEFFLFEGLLERPNYD